MHPRFLKRSIAPALVLAVLGSTLSVPARAQWAVIDVSAIAQLVRQVETLTRQLETAESQLLAAKQTLQSTTGGRGMELLLSGTTRNYLPTSWAGLVSALDGRSSYPGLSANVQSAVGANAVLTAAQLSNLSTADQQQINVSRQTVALRQALVEQALANSSARFAAIQSLIAAIGRAGDQKAILDLQTRISAELGMLQNEQTKLQVLAQASQAQESANTQRARELEIVAQGRFDGRFQPTP